MSTHSSQQEGSTSRLLQLCVGYFFFYVITGVSIKYFLGKPSEGFPGMKGMEFLAYSLLGGTGFCLVVVLTLRWYRMESNRLVNWGPLTFPSEYLYIVPSGICTAFVVPATTLMYTLPISVMVAMIIMRGSVILSSRLVDAIQIRQGLYKKKVYPEENVAVVFALLAVLIHLVWSRQGSFDFFRSPLAMTIFVGYIFAYGLRIYIMNYFKNTRVKGAKSDNRAFFAVEQIVTSLCLTAFGLVFFFAPTWLGWKAPQFDLFRSAFLQPKPQWPWAILASVSFGVVAFFSVAIFMFKGRSATFAGLVNRLTSLLAGTVATLIFHFGFGGKFPQSTDWLSLFFICISVVFLSHAERKRRASTV